MQPERFVGLLHDLQRFDSDRLWAVVKLHAAAAVELDVDKTGGDYCAVD